MRSLNPDVLREALASAKSKRRSRRGMNLVEIMIVIAIIVILISVLSVAAIQAFEASKVSTTRLQVNEMGKMIMNETMLVGSKVPSNLSEVEGVKESMLVDGWGRELEYITPGPDGSAFDIISLGRDGAEGGSGRDGDIKFSDL
ncbi:MAG: type II secretion system protein GspG [Myxococcota bacterium]